MNLELSDEQELLKDTARRFLEKECSKTLVRELSENVDGNGDSSLLWRHMVELGWLGLPIPEEYDGTGASFLDLSVVLEEMGRALLPGPYFSTLLLGGFPILEAGSDEQKARLLPKVASGQLVLTLAWLETSAAYDPTDVRLAARSEGGDFVLDGVKLLVPNADIADIILTVGRQPDGEVTIFLVDRHSKGIACTPHRMTDGSKVYEVSYEGVRVPQGDVLGALDGCEATLERTLGRAAIAECLFLIGGAQVALEMSVEHVKNRVQFGQIVGQFQAVQHSCADMATDLDGARFLTYHAAWKISEGLPCAREVAMTKAWVSEACNRIIARAHQVHGGVGFITEHDLTLYFKRTKVGAAAYGGPNFHYRSLAQTLGL